MNTWVATSFADVADLVEYNKRVREGMSTTEALNYGDQGVGEWGLSTVAGTGPACALPRPYTPNSGKARVHVKGLSVDCEIRDRGPEGIIDLNPDACFALGLVPPVKEIVEWELVK